MICVLVANSPESALGSFLTFHGHYHYTELCG